MPCSRCFAAPIQHNFSFATTLQSLFQLRLPRLPSLQTHQPTLTRPLQDGDTLDVCPLPVMNVSVSRREHRSSDSWPLSLSERRTHPWTRVSNSFSTKRAFPAVSTKRVGNTLTPSYAEPSTGLKASHFLRASVSSQTVLLMNVFFDVVTHSLKQSIMISSRHVLIYRRKRITLLRSKSRNLCFVCPCQSHRVE